MDPRALPLEQDDSDIIISIDRSSSSSEDSNAHESNLSEKTEAPLDWKQLPQDIINLISAKLSYKDLASLSQASHELNQLIEKTPEGKLAREAHQLAPNAFRLALKNNPKAAAAIIIVATILFGMIVGGGFSALNSSLSTSIMIAVMAGFLGGIIATYSLSAFDKFCLLPNEKKIEESQTKIQEIQARLAPSNKLI